jgi:archaellum component FlaC
MSKDNVIQFPNVRERVGKKYREEELDHINEMLRLCDEDMATILGQIDQLQLELTGLTHEYEKLTARLKQLLLIEGEGDE